MPIITYPKVKLWLVNKNGDAVLGDGLATLLEAVEKYGSVSAASDHLSMSYRYALHRISLAERRVGCELVKRSRGGTAGGFSELIADGKALLAKYRKTERQLEKFLKELVE